MMMRMLEAGGMASLIDNIRQADADNPRGYYEYEAVKKIKEDVSWLAQAQGKAVKMVSMLLRHLPPTYQYRIIFMRRNMSEILASQSKMLARLGKHQSPSADERMAALFAKHLVDVEQWLSKQKNMRVIYMDYGAVLADPLGSAQTLTAFIDQPLNSANMAASVDKLLYRNKL
jgi:hypothetical protein